MIQWLSNFAEGCFDLMAPPMCCRCHAAIDDSPRTTAASLCENCVAELSPPVDSICKRCAAPAPAASIDDKGCWRCRTTRFPFIETVSLGVYQNELRDAVLQAKGSGGSFLAGALARLLAERVQQRFESPHDLMVHVPMHWMRRITRSMNLPRFCAELLGEQLAIPHYAIVKCDRLIERQSSLAPTARPGNVRGAYLLKRPHVVESRRVLLIDDILTTGATCVSIARELRNAGAERVDVAVLARGIGWA